MLVEVLVVWFGVGFVFEYLCEWCDIYGCMLLWYEQVYIVMEQVFCIEVVVCEYVLVFCDMMFFIIVLCSQYYFDDDLLLVEVVVFQCCCDLMLFCVFDLFWQVDCFLCDGFEVWVCFDVCFCIVL